jgi:hypothetical protein
MLAKVIALVIPLGLDTFAVAAPPWASPGWRRRGVSASRC